MVAVPLGELDGLAGPITQIIELGSPGPAASNRLDIEDIGRMQREDSFDALVTDHSPNGEVFVNAPSFAGNDRAGKYLRSLFLVLGTDWSIWDKRIAILSSPHLVHTFLFHELHR